MKMHEFRLKISLNLVPEGSINNIPALVQIMARCRAGDKPSPDPMMVNLPTHMTRPQRVNKTLHFAKILFTTIFIQHLRSMHCQDAGIFVTRQNAIQHMPWTFCVNQKSVNV